MEGAMSDEQGCGYGKQQTDRTDSAYVAEWSLRIWALELASRCGLHKDELLSKAREFADYVRAAGKPDA